MSLLVFGTVALDNVKTPVGSRKDMLGGSAAHFSMSARLFTDVHLVGVIGEDFPKKHLSLFKKKGINTSSLKVESGKTFAWDGEYDAKDLNTALTNKTELGVLQTYIPEVTPAQSKISNVFLANYDPIAQGKLLDVMKSPKLVGLDTMNLWIDHMKKDLLDLMKRIDIFFVNDGEARELSGEDNLIKSVKALKKMGPKIIVLKKGEHGVLCYDGKTMFGLPAYPVEEVVDPTGAGDTFAGGVMGYLVKVKKVNMKVLRDAAVYATVLSSFNVEGFGPSKPSALKMVDVNKRKKEFLKFIS